MISILSYILLARVGIRPATDRHHLRILLASQTQAQGRNDRQDTPLCILHVSQQYPLLLLPYRFAACCIFVLQKIRRPIYTRPNRYIP